MKITAIIAEYNPFHNGHAYHIKESCALAGETYIICVMSGNFVQRGEPAIADKWERTRMALYGGADLVIELPFLYATQSAEGFAMGAVEIVDALGCVDHLSFGSECCELSTLKSYAEVLANEPPEFQTMLRAYLDEGHSFPRARELALSGIFSGEADVLSSSNDILAVEYLKALIQFESKVEPLCIKRRGSGYRDSAMAVDFSSATAIRKELREHGVTGKVLSNLPPQSVSALAASPLVDTEEYFRLVQFKLRTMSTADIANIYDVTEGLENRIKSAAQSSKNYWELIMGIKSKRYTYTRVARVLLYCLFGVTKDAIGAANGNFPLYARVLGMRRHSKKLLAFLAKQSHIPVITKSSEFKDNPLLRYDILATDIYSLLSKEISPSGRDYTERFITL